MAGVSGGIWVLVKTEPSFEKELGLFAARSRVAGKPEANLYFLNTPSTAR
jgi:hypothetical protein